MIAKIIEYSARNKFIIFLLVFFLGVWGYWALKKTPLDAIPDLSDTQVIIYTEWTGRSPDLVEDQITYPITSTLLAAPKVQAVRGFSYLGSSFIYVIFEEGTDIYWARSRMLEYLQAVKNKLPADVNPVLGPDATSLGWGFPMPLWMRRETGPGPTSLPPGLESEAGPGKRSRGFPGGEHRRVCQTVPDHHGSEPPFGLQHPHHQSHGGRPEKQPGVEGRVIEFSGVEYMVRGRGYIKSLDDLENISVGTNGTGNPDLSEGRGRDPAWSGDPQGDCRPGRKRRGGRRDRRGPVRGKCPQRDRAGQGKNQERYRTQPAQGVKIVTTYDRSDLIHRSIDTLKEEIIKLPSPSAWSASFFCSICPAPWWSS